MRTPISLAVAALLYASAAMAEPVPLTNSALDRVTAGSADETLQGSGGAIIGNNSKAKLVLTGTLDLAGKAQSDARALNLVNSSESTAANGVNVWDGKLPETALPGATGQFEVEQQNVVNQEQRRVALVPRYERTGANESSSWTENSSHASASNSTTTTKTFDVESSTSTRNLTASGTVDTQTAIAGQTIQGGRGLAGAGDLHVDFDGGNIGLGIAGNIGGGVLEGSIDLNIELPELTVDFNGGGCAVQMGSCAGESTLDESTETLSDHSIFETVASAESSEEAFIGGGTEEIRSPFYLADAQAEYIVVDDSQLDVESNYGISLAGNAQSGVRALNAVNAAGSAVANAVNISRTPSLTSTASLALVQSNVIQHSR